MGQITNSEQTRNKQRNPHGATNIHKTALRKLAESANEILLRSGETRGWFVVCPASYTHVHNESLKPLVHQGVRLLLGVAVCVALLEVVRVAVLRGVAVDVAVGVRDGVAVDDVVPVMVSG